MKTSKRSFFAVLTALALVASMLLGMASCGMKVSAVDLMEGITPRESADIPPVSAESSANAADFAVRLFKAANESGKNTLVSPLSVLAALAMTSNGAKGETKEQMENVLGMSTDDLNRFFCGYMRALSGDGEKKLKLANSIWFTSDSRFTVNRDFLQTNADYYGADAYSAPFDNSTLKDINSWVKDRTDGMIPSILDRIPENAVMYLVNALAFEAEWSVTYKDEQVREGTFTLEDGTKKTVDFMYSGENRYLEDDKATGFIKYYKGQKFAFAALLPNEGVAVDEYVASLSGEKLSKMLAEAPSVSVQTSMPKFETDYDTEMSEILKSMGMPLAFDPDGADLSGLGKSAAGNMYVGRVLHKTFISVAEKGTKAGAATAVEVLDKSAPHFEDAKKVYLDRPFVYMLIDTENNIPFFIGSLMDVGR